METAIKIAAENVATLRKSDVYRVLEQNPSSIRAALASYIRDNRADLVSEVDECLEDLA